MNWLWGRSKWIALVSLGVLLGKAEADLNVQNGITFGPVMNWSYGGVKTGFSCGFNVAYWDYRTAIPWSINLGLELSRVDGWLVYPELQTGAVFIGASAGPVYSTTKGWGAQGSIWGNLFGGAQLRYRYLDGTRTVPGLYFAIPLVRTTGGLTEAQPDTAQR